MFSSKSQSPFHAASIAGSVADNIPHQAGRFTVSKVNDDGSTVQPSVIVPVSIFDDHNTKFILKQKAQAVTSDEQEQRISFDEFKNRFQGVAVPGTLTLYEDDFGNVDSVKTVIKKAVEAADIDSGKTTGRKKPNLGTFLGVFLPCCQNIVGVIYFVRFPWIVGTAGLVESFLIVFICNMMSVCTAISMSAIATNGKLTAGGTYFMISRSLGPTFGGSVGILFFMGTSISVAMYYLGTVETFLTYIAPQMAVFAHNPADEARFYDYRLFGSIQLFCMACIAFIGVKCVSRFACCAIVFLVAAICSVLLGIAMAAPERSVKICAFGDRLIRYSIVSQNNTLQCHKNVSGPIYNAYCKWNDTTMEATCDEYFFQNEASLIPGVPGFSFKRLLSSMPTFYTVKGSVPGTKVKSHPDYELITDITTSFVILMAIYFPSITGVESGSNYSGELKDAQVAIPRGTMAAVAVTSSLYLGSVVLMSGSVDGLLLRDKYGESISMIGDLVLSRMAWPSKWVVLIGTLTATIGAGLQAMAGGPRLLQAIAEDNIIPHLGFFAKKWRGEPIRGLLATYIIAEIGILIAFLDYVAPIVTMFFLMCYGFINFAVTLQSLLDTPHWRPSFKCYHWSLTMFGSALCLVNMFICSWKYAIAAIIMMFLLYQYIEYKGAEKEWGDGITGLSMTGALYALGHMKQDFHHTKNWRPQILVLLRMCDMDDQTHFKTNDHDLIMLGDMMKEGKGLTMFATVIKGNLGDNVKERDKLRKIYEVCLENAGVKGFIEVIVAPSIVDGLCCLVQSAGLGALRPNTIVMGWPREWSGSRNIISMHIFLETMWNIALAKNAVIVLKCNDFPSKNMRITGTIDIWWIVNDGGMLLLLGHLLRRNKTWSKCQLRLFTVAMENDNTIQIKEDLQTYLYQLRIEGTVHVVEMAGDDMMAYVYERTLKMEERNRILTNIAKSEQRRMSYSSRKLLNREVQQVLENARSMIDLSQPKKVKPADDSSPIDHVLPTQENIRHMNTAVRLNATLRELSGAASLVILNLPCVPVSPSGRANYMSFLEVLTEGLNRLLLVRGTGREVITVYN